MRQKEKIVEWIKNITVLLLLIALVCLCAIDLFSYQGSETPTFTRNMFAAIASESVQYRYMSYLSPSYVMPRFIGFSVPSLGNPIGLFCGGEEAARVYDTLTPFFGKLFGEDGHVAELSQGKGMQMLASVLEGEYIYLAFRCDLPTSFLLTLTDSGAKSGRAEEKYISEIFIVPEAFALDGVVVMPEGTLKRQKLYSFSALARDSAGRFYRYTTDYVPKTIDAVGFHTNFYESYNTLSEAVPYLFPGDVIANDFLIGEGFFGKVSETTPIPGKAIPGAVLRRSYGILTSDSEILKSFYMNPQMVSSYTDETGARYYFDEGENLKIYADGTLEYSASSAGIPFSSIFGTGGKREYSTADALGAALMFLRTTELSRLVNETKDMELVLCRVSYDGERLIFGFGVTFRNLSILLDGKAEMLSITMREGHICEVVSSGAAFSATTQTCEMPDMMLALRIRLAEHLPIGVVYPVYAFEGQGEEGKIELAHISR